MIVKGELVFDIFSRVRDRRVKTIVYDCTLGFVLVDPFSSSIKIDTFHFTAIPRLSYILCNLWNLAFHYYLIDSPSRFYWNSLTILRAKSTSLLYSNRIRMHLLIPFRESTLFVVIIPDYFNSNRTFILEMKDSVDKMTISAFKTNSFTFFCN